MNFAPKIHEEKDQAITLCHFDLIPYCGKSLMFWALEWFRMSNDTFFELYGFNFNPHDYPGLYAAARERVYGKER